MAPNIETTTARGASTMDLPLFFALVFFGWLLQDAFFGGGADSGDK